MVIQICFNRLTTNCIGCFVDIPVQVTITPVKLRWLAKFVEDKWIGLNTIAELVRLAADQNGDAEEFGNKTDFSRTNPWHDVTIRKDGVSTKENLSDLQREALHSTAVVSLRILEASK